MTAAARRTGMEHPQVSAGLCVVCVWGGGGEGGQVNQGKGSIRSDYKRSGIGRIGRMLSDGPLAYIFIQLPVLDMYLGYLSYCTCTYGFTCMRSVH